MFTQFNGTLDLFSDFNSVYTSALSNAPSLSGGETLTVTQTAGGPPTTFIAAVDPGQISATISILPDFFGLAGDLTKITAEVSITAELIRVGQIYINGIFDGYTYTSISSTEEPDQLLDASYDPLSATPFTFEDFPPSLISWPPNQPPNFFGRSVTWTDKYFLTIEVYSLKVVDFVDLTTIGRVLVTLGNPTGQRSDVWGGWIDFISAQNQTPTLDDLVPDKIYNLPEYLEFEADTSGKSYSDLFEIIPDGSWSNLDTSNPPGEVGTSGTEQKELSLILGSGFWDNVESKFDGLLEVRFGELGRAIKDSKDVGKVAVHFYSETVDALTDMLYLKITPDQAWDRVLNAKSELVQETKDYVENKFGKAVSDLLVDFLANEPISTEQVNSFRVAAFGNSHLFGSDNGDVILATAHDDVVDAKGGYDTVFLGGGNDVYLQNSVDFLDEVHGGAGFDAVKFATAFSFTSSSKDLNGWYTLGYSDGNGIITVKEVERAEFGTVTIAFDIEGNAGQAYRLYQAAFDRVPDKAGLGYWISELDSGKSDLPLVSLSFIQSAEFQATYGNPSTVSDAQFVTLLYQNVLDRAPDQAGLNHWLNDLSNGYRREDLLTFFSESVENKANVIGAIDNGIEFVPWA